jgi:predicted nucleic-acid-binding protein
VVAVDTNVLIRLVTNDHPAQAARAAAVFRSGPVFVTKSVLLEAEWVLRYSYDLDTEAILRALRGVLGLANVSVEDPAATAMALRLREQGLEFADALHLASSAHADRFVTFDARLVKRAARVAPGRVGLA